MAAVKLAIFCSPCHGGAQQEMLHLSSRQRTAWLHLVRPAYSRASHWNASRLGTASASLEDEGTGPSTRLGSIIRTKQRILKSQLGAMTAGQLEERLGSVKPVPSAYQLLERIASGSFQGRTTIVAEVARLSPAESPQSLAQRCSQYVDWGADVIAVRTDEEKSPDGLADLRAVCKAVQVPVLRKDWVIHPLQIVETREAGAAGLTAVCSVLSKGTAAILNYTVSLGLDAIVEVINLKEVQEMVPLGIPLYGINVSVALSLPVPGIRESIAKSLIGEIPFGATSVVGVRSDDEARQMKLAGADAVYLGFEVLQGTRGSDYHQDRLQKFLGDLKFAMSGDD